MVQLTALSDAQVILLATLLTAESELDKLQTLASERKDILTPNLLYRLLITYLPCDPAVEPLLEIFLKHLQNDFHSISTLDAPFDISPIQDVKPRIAETRLQTLRLDTVPTRCSKEESDQLADFLLEWVHRLEPVSGLTMETLRLIEAFANDHPVLLDWKETYLIPLLRLQNQFYPDLADSLNLKEMESMEGVRGVRTLLQFTEGSGGIANVGRDIEQVAVPWIAGASNSKRRRVENSSEKQTSWQDINEWIFRTSQSNYELAAAALLKWEGPPSPIQPDGTYNDHETSLAYVQTMMAVAFAPDQSQNTNLGLRRKLLERSTILTGFKLSQLDAALPSIPPPVSLSNASRADLLENALLRKGNLLTVPSGDSLCLLQGVLATQVLLDSYKILSTTSGVATVALFDSEEKQKQELRLILTQIPRMTRSNAGWQIVRSQLLWLRTWSASKPDLNPSNTTIAYLSHISVDYLEVQILDAILAAGEYPTAISTYVDSHEKPLPLETVKDRVVATIYHAYDNASNSNRTRGGVKRAFETLKAFQPYFKTTTDFNHIDHLIKATHDLSFYQLTLQHGVPFQPVNIRVHKDPLSLIGKILDQNERAYTKLDDLLEIGHNLVLADLPTPESNNMSTEQPSLDRRLFDAQHRITYLAISSALSSHDFDTAYSYITTRLSTSPSAMQPAQFADDTSWRAAYAAGKYRPQSAPKDLHDRIASLSKRMDLLSLALTLAPTPEPLSEILATWRRCEEEMDSLKTQAQDEERAFDAHAYASGVPGGFGLEDRDMDAAETRRAMAYRSSGTTRGVGGGGMSSYSEEAPMGLFDVARGAASAIRKSAFPLRGPDRSRDRPTHAFETAPSRSQETPRHSLDDSRPGSSGDEAQQRVRKRDMISNVVTGGFVSGMSWVLGAQPVENKEEDDVRH